MREKVRPKMGKIDIDYQKLHDAFFKWQTKPKLTIHGDLYYEVRGWGGEATLGLRSWLCHSGSEGLWKQVWCPLPPAFALSINSLWMGWNWNKVVL